jgi:signal transduction histidine kinase
MFYSGFDNFENIMTHYLLNEVIAKIEYPIIITDSDQSPVFWKNIEIQEDISWHDLSPDSQDIIIRRLQKIRASGHIVPLIHTGETKTVLGYTFYEDSILLKRLKILPYVVIFLLVFFTTFGLYAMSHIRNDEKRMLWVGLAKETAHQFGTPISSLIGWIDLIKMKVDDLPQREKFHEMLEDMSADIESLKKVASRFGKVGSQVKLQSVNIDSLLRQCCEYFQKRIPHVNNQITIHYTTTAPDAMLMLDIELISWAFENMLKNCIDAMKYKSGNITVESFIKENKYHIRFSDQGVGLPKSMYNKIFDPGVTTKSRGWGLGLSLSKRIVEEYHHGKIRVLESVIEEGTTFEILLPINPIL